MVLWQNGLYMELLYSHTTTIYKMYSHGIYFREIYECLHRRVYSGMMISFTFYSCPCILSLWTYRYISTKNIYVEKYTYIYTYIYFLYIKRNYLSLSIYDTVIYITKHITLVIIIFYYLCRVSKYFHL